MHLSKKYKADIIFFAILAVISLSLLLYVNVSKKEGGYVVVRVNGEDVCTYSLMDEGTYPLNGGTNILVIKDGYAYLEDANCPDKLCVNQGKIHNDGEVITCLPNKLTVTVYSLEEDVDLIS